MSAAAVRAAWDALQRPIENAEREISQFFRQDATRNMRLRCNAEKKGLAKAIRVLAEHSTPACEFELRCWADAIDLMELECGS